MRRPRAARAAREGLDNLIFVVNCNLQRLDGPVRGNGKIIQSATFDFTPYVALALIYIVITIPQARFVDWLVERDRRRRQATVGV